MEQFMEIMAVEPPQTQEEESKSDDGCTCSCECDEKTGKWTSKSTVGVPTWI